MKTTNILVYGPNNIPPIIKTTQNVNFTIKDVCAIKQGIIVVGGTWDSCVVADDSVVPESILKRFDQQSVNIGKIKQYDEINDVVLFIGGGYIFQHFGHFLIEGMSRYWPLLYSKYKNVKIAVCVKKNQQLPSFVYKTLNAMGVDNKNIITVHKNTKFRMVYVPKQSAIIGVATLPIAHRVYFKIANVLSKQKIKTYDKLFLSRRKMKDNRTFGEKQIENIFAKNGYKIIYPETLPLEQQIALVHNCKIMAGTSGSALHMAVFMKRGGTVIQLKRNSGNSDNINIQQKLNDSSGVNTIFIYSSIEKQQTNHFTFVPQIIGVTPYLVEFFKDFGFKYTNKDINIDKSEYNRYICQLYKYKFQQRYARFVQPLIRMVSLIGFTKRGREIIREWLNKLLNAKKHK